MTLVLSPSGPGNQRRCFETRWSWRWRQKFPSTCW